MINNIGINSNGYTAYIITYDPSTIYFGLEENTIDKMQKDIDDNKTIRTINFRSGRMKTYRSIVHFISDQIVHETLHAILLNDDPLIQSGIDYFQALGALP